MAEIFRNLITNAIKYNICKPKIIEIGVTRIQEECPGRVVFYVRDNGIGIPDSQQENIFAMFKRLHSRDKYGGGTGSGLAIVKRIVDQHNGKIWVKSKAGEGSTFYFCVDNA